MLTSSLAVGTLPAIVGTAIFVGGAVMLDKAVDHGRMINANRSARPWWRRSRKPQPPAPLKLCARAGLLPRLNKGFTALCREESRQAKQPRKNSDKETTPPKPQPKQQPKT